MYISQAFGNVWISDRDQVIGGIQVKKGDNVYQKLFDLNGHNGIDIAAPIGTILYAPHDGYIVEATEKTGGYGIRVSLFHKSEGKEYLHVFGHLNDYKPLDENSYHYFYRGKFVRQGEMIGHVDSTGFSTGHHLHWGLYEYKNGFKHNNNNGYQGAINPAPFIKENVMEWYQIVGESTLVVKNFQGKYYKLATTPELYPYVAKIFGLEGQQFDPIDKALVEANLAGTAQAGINFVEK